MTETVILVNENDVQIGYEEKMQAHIDEKLHRAFSIFIFNANGEMLLQQRADTKYHCGGLWTNTCCSHPRPGENVSDAAHRRLVEEMGFDTKLKKLFDFVYKAKFDDKLFEYEFDHVFIGRYDKDINVNPDEVKNYKWINIDTLHADIKNYPEKYTVWFKIAFEKMMNKHNVNLLLQGD